MSTIALKIANGGADEDFYDYEVLSTRFENGDTSLVKILGTGEHKAVNRTGYGKLIVEFNLQSTNIDTATTTLRKLQLVDAYSASGGKLTIYYVYIGDNTRTGTFILPDGQIPDDLAVAGRNAGRERLTVEFLEVST